MPATDRLHLYYFLLPFTSLSLLIYCSILCEICRKKMYTGFFYRMFCSQAIYDINHVTIYFVAEIPQDWPVLFPFLTSLNGSVVPQLIYAHLYVCLLAQVIGVTAMSISRMVTVCLPSSIFFTALTELSLLKTVACQSTIPLAYAIFMINGQDWRTFEYSKERNKIMRVGSTESVELNSNIMLACSIAGAAVSAVCYIRVFITIRKSPIRYRKRELSLIVTSFVLFCILCTITAYFVFSLLFVVRNWDGFYMVRRHAYAFSFSISLANPWCLMLTHPTLRSAVLRRCLPLGCMRGLFDSVCLPETPFHTTVAANSHHAAAATHSRRSAVAPAIPMTFLR